MPKKANQEETRQHNASLVLNLIYQSESISRVEIARSTGLTRTTVSDIVASFIAQGLVIETGRSPSTGGKPAILLQMDENARYLIGIDLAESEFRGALVNLKGRVIYRVQQSIVNRDGESALRLVSTLIQSLLDQAGQPVIGIGIGVPGLLDAASGVVRQAVNLNWQDLPLENLLFEQFQIPVHIANDCQAAALGEFTFGEHPQSGNLLLVKAGRGVGAGIVMGGQIFFGDHAGAGEIGHIQVKPDGERCRCGNIGCLETIVSSRSFVERALSKTSVGGVSAPDWIPALPDEMSMVLLLDAHQNADPWVRALIREFGEILGGVVVHLVGALNIDQICIAGELSQFGDALIEPIRQRVRTGTLKTLSSQTKIEVTNLGEDIVILGAASLILKNELGLF